MAQPPTSVTPFGSAPVIQQDTPVMQMPLDVVIQILNRLRGREIGACTQVCRQWNQMLKGNEVWRPLVERHFPNIDPSDIEDFQDTYQTVYSNFVKSVYASHTFQGHDGMIWSVAIADGMLFSGSSDNKIKVWDIKTGKCLTTLQGHTNTVYSLAIADGMLFSGSFDRTIKAWDIKTGKCVNTFQGHTDGVNSVAVADGMLFSGSGSKDHTIKVWDIKTGKCLTTLQGHTNTVYSLAIADGMLFSGSFDRTIKAWDIKTGKCVNTFRGHIHSVYSIAIADGILFSGSYDCTIKAWDIKTGNCLTTFRGHKEEVWSVAIADGMLFSGSSDSTIKAWDIKTGNCLNTFRGHKKEVLAVAIADGIPFSSSHDSTIKAWDFTANHIVIFEELAELLEKKEVHASQQALERFVRMPKKAKDAIYGKLYEICKPFANEYWEIGEHAFHDQNGQRTTSTQKARAIRNYLNDQPPLKLPLLLAHLGINLEKDYLEKLECRSGHLQKIGILSPEDLNVICSTSNFSKLTTVHEIVEWDFRDNKVKMEAQERKANLETLVEELSKGNEDKIQETNGCGVILYETECPWVSFQQKLKAFQTKLNEIVQKADTAKSMVEAFNLENYQGLANELKALIDEFQALDRNHQIAKLHAYVNQWGILNAWNTLRSQKVLSLSALPELQRSLQKLLQMGE